DPAEELLRRLHDDAVLARQVASAKHSEGVLGQRRRHLRTVRSAARARNQPRSALAWTLCLVLLCATVFLLSLRIAEGATPVADVDTATQRPRASASAAP